jgi:hypothetical protein
MDMIRKKLWIGNNPVLLKAVYEVLEVAGFRMKYREDHIERNVESLYLCTNEKVQGAPIVGNMPQGSLSFFEKYTHEEIFFGDLVHLFKPVETIEIAGKKYSKEAFEEAVSDLKEVK